MGLILDVDPLASSSTQKRHPELPQRRRTIRLPSAKVGAVV
jgi:hypothetical protein